MTRPSRRPSALEIDRLVDRCAVGDAKAFRNLYEITAPQLFGLVMRIVKDRRAAEAVLHETFVQIWRNADENSRRQGKATGWVVSLARYQAINALRGGREATADEASEGKEAQQDDVAAPPAAAALSGAIHRTELALLYHCLNRLPEKPRQSIALAFLDGLSIEEVAERLDEPVETIRSWIRRGLMRLKECLKAHGH